MNIKEILNNKKKPKVLIIGDVMLDTFILGKHLGKSPEGPIPLVKKNKEYSTAGAAALVAQCVNKMGGNSFLIGGHGKDANGAELNYKIKKNKIKNYIITSSNSVTTSKTRIFSNLKPLLRLDCEDQFKISEKETSKLKKKIKQKIKLSDVIIVSDYGKGFCSKEILKFIIKITNDFEIPLLIDTRKNAKDFNIYRKSYCIKPNFFEAKSIYKSLKKNDKSLKKCSLLFKKKYRLKNVIITLGQDGSTLLDEKNNFYHFKDKVRKNIDVTGAGDNFISALAVLLSLTKNLKIASNISNKLSGIAVEKFGTYAVTKEIFYSEIKKQPDNI